MKKEGDKSKAICEHCNKIVSTTYKTKDVVLYDGENQIPLKNILVGECDTCLNTISIPQKSFLK
jgi:hypothetical protein